MELGLVTFLLKIGFRTASLESVFKQERQVAKGDLWLLSKALGLDTEHGIHSPDWASQLWQKGGEPGPVLGTLETLGQDTWEALRIQRRGLTFSQDAEGRGRTAQPRDGEQSHPGV